MRTRDWSSSFRRRPARAALTGLVWLVACLNPRPEELPSNASSVEPGAAQTGNSTADDAAGKDPTGTESVVGEPNRGASPEDPATDTNPAPQSPGPAFAEPSDAGAPAVSDAGSDAG